MLARGHGRVVTIASMAGLLGVAGLCDYSASKFGAVAFGLGHGVASHTLPELTELN